MLTLNNTNTIERLQKAIKNGITYQLPDAKWANRKEHNKGEASYAPARNIKLLSTEDKQLAIKNALRYFPENQHEALIKEFVQELTDYGRIYMYRLRPTDYDMKAHPISYYPAKCKQAAAIMLMIQNNLDPAVAKHPLELITYGGNGAVFQNWAQYLLTMQYLSEMTEEQTLVLYSGHPMGLFPSHPNAPRVVVTNGMMIPNYSSKEDWNRFNALGVTQYGQMTAGSFMYIGPQGIVHGTTLTLLNAGRLNKLIENNQLRGKLFITSGLGGMSGAQAKAAVITGCVGVLAEIDPAAVKQRINDGYVKAENCYENINELIEAIKKAVANKEGVALVYVGNVVELWEKLLAENITVHLGSDQTSLHNIDDCGYIPIGYSFDQASELLRTDKTKFMAEVKNTLQRHVAAVNALANKGMYFFDYGNAFLKEAGRADADIWQSDAKKVFKYPSYVEDIMGPMCFDYGFGPFRWVCTSCDDNDLSVSDGIAAEVLKDMLQDAPEEIQQQLADNLHWINTAEENRLVVGSKARILYTDAEGRINIARAFNRAVKEGRLSAPIVLGRDHHDVSGTDSPYRETANIKDGSKFTADMAIHNVIGDAFRGATWVSIHNGGGVGWGEVINGGFGLLLDGSDDADRRLQDMLFWDVNNGIARRSWARNEGAIFAIKRAMQQNAKLKVTLPNLVNDNLLNDLF